MERAEKNWERLVRATLQRGQLRSQVPKRAASGLAGPVPASLQNTANIDAILKAADEIQDEDPNVARILCEHAYSLAQNLDPVSEGRGVLQFKTGLMSVIKQKRAKRDGGTIDRNQDIVRLQEFYKSYREKNRVDEFQEEEKKLQSGAFSGDLRELERRTVKMKRVHATLKVLGEVVEALTNLIPEELKRVMEADAAMTEEVAYNIIPLDAPAPTNAITTFPEVRAAVSALSNSGDLAKLPDSYPVPKIRGLDVLDLLCCVFGFQKDNVSNQREHIILLLSNAQVRLGIPHEAEPKVDEAAIQNVFNKSLDNYIKWCEYLGIHPVWNNLESLQKEKKLLLVSLYYLIWGEAANVRFLPECICYIFHQMARELEEILRQQWVQPAKSCIGADGVSFLEQVILPLYETIAAEAAICDNAKASHSSWRNYDDFNEFFWSLRCFDLGWPWRKEAAFFFKPKKNVLRANQRTGKTCFVEHRTFFHLYHSFHRLWIFLVMVFQGLTIIAFNKGKFNSHTIKDLLSLGPTFLVMKFIESILDILMMYGAYATTRSLAVSRIFLRFVWFGVFSGILTYLYVKGLQDESGSNANSFFFRAYIFVLGVYAAALIFVSFLIRIPACRMLTNKCDQWSVVRFMKWMRQEHYYIGRGLYERTSDFLRYVLFWLVVFSCKFSFAYFLQIRPLVEPTKIIMFDIPDVQYTWHDFVSKNNHNALTIASLWAPVLAIYTLDLHVWYTVLSAIVGGLIGAKDRLGEIRSIETVHKRFKHFPEAFVKSLQATSNKRGGRDMSSGQCIQLRVH